MTPITVIMPVRNGGEHLSEALESLSAQTFGDFRVLALDDASADHTHELLKAHAAKDGRFEILKSAHPLGIPAALNLLLDRVETPYVARMDGDDVCAPKRLEIQLEAALASPQTALWGGLVEEVGQSGAGWGEYVSWVNSVVGEEEIKLNCLTESPLPHPTWFFRTDAVKEAGGYREGLFPEDYELFLRLLARGEKIGKVAETVLGWRDHPNRETRVSRRCSFDSFLRLKASYFKRLKERGVIKVPEKPLALWGAGRTGKVALRELLKTGVDVSLLIDPQKAGRNEMGIRVADPSKVTLNDYFILTAVRFRDIREMVEEYYRERKMAFGLDYLWLY